RLAGARALLNSKASIMNRRQFLASAAGCAVARAAATERPNILFLIADQIREDALGVSGNQWIKTPNLDRLARGGVHFANAYTPQALCTPARSALMTGVYPHTSRLDHNVYEVPNVFQMAE